MTEPGVVPDRLTRSDVVGPAIILFLGLVETAFGSQEHVVRALVGVVAVTVPLLWRRRYPLAVVIAVTAATSAQAFVGVDLRQPVYILPAALLASYSLAAWAPRSRAIVGLVAAWVIEAVGAMHRPDAEVSELWFIASALAVAWGFGLAWRARHLRAEALSAEAVNHAVVDAEHRAEAVAAERARIARELHDIVAHNITVIAVQAGAAELVMEREPQRAREALNDIQTTAQSTLSELRHLLTLLRSMPEATSAPVPGLADLPDLLERASSSGLVGSLSIEGQAPASEPGLELTIYRVVQEAMTNAIRHGRASSLDVRLRFTPSEVQLDIDDDGEPAASSSGLGHGVIGMQERLELYGGSLRTGPREGRGYAVRAVVPMPGVVR